MVVRIGVAGVPDASLTEQNKYLFKKRHPVFALSSGYGRGHVTGILPMLIG